MRRFISLGALGMLGSVVGVLAQENAECLESCVTSNTANFEQFGCTNAIEEGCMCPNENFRYSMRDCSIQSCGAVESDAWDWLYRPDAGFCRNHARPEPSEGEEEPATTEAPATTEVPQTTEPAPEAEETSSSVESEPATTEAAPEATPTESVATDVSESSTAASTSTEASSTTETGAATTSDADGADEDDEEEEGGGGGGLSQGAAVGIGVGVAVMFVAIFIVGAVFWMRRRRNQKPADQSVDISRPMPPSAGRGYPSMDRASFGEKGRGGESIEMHTNRYEDMPPRQTPRIMV